MLGVSDRRLRNGTLDDVLDALPMMVAELFSREAPGSARAAATDGGPSSEPADTRAALDELVPDDVLASLRPKLRLAVEPQLPFATLGQPPEDDGPRRGTRPPQSSLPAIAA